MRVSPMVLLFAGLAFATPSLRAEEIEDHVVKIADPVLTAQTATIEGRASEGIELLEGTVKHAPQDVDAWIGLGILYKHAKRTDRAQACFKKARTLLPSEASRLVRERDDDFQGRVKAYHEALAEAGELPLPCKTGQPHDPPVVKKKTKWDLPEAEPLPEDPVETGRPRQARQDAVEQQKPSGKAGGAAKSEHAASAANKDQLKAVGKMAIDQPRLKTHKAAK